jgi:hypothetical protein
MGSPSITTDSGCAVASTLKPAVIVAAVLAGLELADATAIAASVAVAALASW